MHGPFFRTRVKARLRLTLRSTGRDFFEINSVLDGLDDDAIQTATALAAQKLGVDAPDEGGLVGGAFLDWITEFLNSEFGKALIDFLMKLLLGLL